MSIIVLRLNTEELLNIEHGLTMMRTQALKHLAEIDPQSARANDMQKYYREKVEQLDAQIKVCKRTCDIEA